jgi:hypothetical protein
VSFSPYILSTLLFLLFITFGSASTKPKFFGVQSITTTFPVTGIWVKLPWLSPNANPYFCTFCLQVFRRPFCQLSTYSLIWGMAAVVLCTAQGKDAQFPCLESSKRHVCAGDLDHYCLCCAGPICLHESYHLLERVGLVLSAFPYFYFQCWRTIWYLEAVFIDELDLRKISSPK